MTALADAPDATPTDRPGGGVGAGLGIGILAAVVGLLPWLLTGARLPLQNLWETQTLPDDMPRALLPVNQYYTSTIAAVLIVGGALAGGAVRLVGQRRGWGGGAAAATAVGVLLVQVGAVVQSFVALRDGLAMGPAGDSRTFLYWVGMLVGTVVCAACSLVACLLISRRSVTPAALGLVLASVPFASWVVAWIITLSGPGGTPAFTSSIGRWAAPAVVVAALVWCGVRSVGRVAVWVVAAFVLYTVPLVITATANALGTRSFRGDPRETVSYMLEVFRSAAAAGLTVQTTLVALAVAAVLTGVRMVARR